jgi:hypothetical protein
MSKRPSMNGLPSGPADGVNAADDMTHQMTGDHHTDKALGYMRKKKMSPMMKHVPPGPNDAVGVSYGSAMSSGPEMIKGYM